jgi:competence protein ComEC
MSTPRHGSLAVLLVLVVLSGAAAGPGVATPDRTDGTLSVHFVNTGGGTSALVVGPTGETLLYDTASHAGEDDVLAYLDERDVDTVDHLVASHGHGDHVAGHPEVIERGVGTAYDSGIDRGTATYRAYEAALDDHDVDRERLRAGDEIPLEGVEVTVLSPPEDPIDGGDYNANSLVLRVEYGETSVLLTGDAGASAERHLVEEHPDAIDVTALQVSKEGSPDGTTGSFLDAVSPAVAVVAGGDHDDPNRPHASVLDRLDDRDVPTYWTTTHGDVVLRTDGETTTVATQREAPTDPDDLRSGSPVAPGLDDDPAADEVVAGESSSESTDRGTGTEEENGTESADENADDDATDTVEPAVLRATSGMEALRATDHIDVADGGATARSTRGPNETGARGLPTVGSATERTTEGSAESRPDADADRLASGEGAEPSPANDGREASPGDRVGVDLDPSVVTPVAAAVVVTGLAGTLFYTRR